MKININNKSVLFLGIGSIGACCINYFEDFFDHNNYNRITLIDSKQSVTLVPCVKNFLEKGAHFLCIDVNRENFNDLLTNQLKFSEGDIVIDLTTQTKSLYLLKCCIIIGVHYFNAALSEDFVQPLSNTAIQHSYIMGLNSQFNIKSTCVVETGMNPGLISSFAKKGVRSIVKKFLVEHKSQSNNSQYKLLSKAFVKKDFKLMAKIIGLRLIVCSENDTQVATNLPNVLFCNTWSNIGLIEEHLEPFQIGIGTHEDLIPFENDDLMQFVLPNVFVAEEIIGGTIKIASIFVDSLDNESKPVFSRGHGRCISHGECISLSRYFAGYDYSPTTYFSYKINPASDKVLEISTESKLQYLMQDPNLITMNQTHQVTGYDNVGALLIYEDQFDQNKIKSWWSGTIFDVKYAQDVLNDDYFLPTAIQVMAGVFCAVSFAIENPGKKIAFYEDLDEKYILKKAQKYLGVIYNGPTDLNIGIKLTDLVLNKTGETKFNHV